MKRLMLPLFSLLLFNSFAQNSYCNEMFGDNIFNGIQVGLGLSSEYKSYFDIDSKNNKVLYLNYKDALSKEVASPLMNMFILADTFQRIKVVLDQGELIKSISITKSEILKQPTYLSNTQYPAIYDDILQRISMTFGYPEVDKEFDEKKYGIYLFSKWICGKISIELGLRISKGVNQNISLNISQVKESVVPAFVKTKSDTTVLIKKEWWQKYWDFWDSDWSFIMFGKNSIILARTQDIKGKNDYKTVWIKTYTKSNKGKSINVVEDMELWEFDCVRNRMKLIKHVKYNADGEVIESKTIEDFMQVWELIIPDSVGEEMLKYVCVER